MKTVNYETHRTKSIGNAKGHWAGHRFFFGEDPYSTENKNESQKMGLHKTTKLLPNKANNQ
jgi:hypothetical protein